MTHKIATRRNRHLAKASKCQRLPKRNPNKIGHGPTGTITYIASPQEIMTKQERRKANKVKATVEHEKAKLRRKLRKLNLNP